MRNFLTALLLCGIQNWVCLNWRAGKSVHFFTAAFLSSGALGNLSTYKLCSQIIDKFLEYKDHPYAHLHFQLLLHSKFLQEQFKE